ncbi:MAG: hypothetical protein LBV79_08620 [Candidatus Adiutrix sp.]|jgi:hypothetical protein|nr:hypothetical protein [Candidatus Adiutrix sp.]
MKINATDYLEQIANKKAAGPDPKEDRGFSKLLEEQKSPSATPAGDSGPQAVGGLENNALVGLIMATGGLDKSAKVGRQLESTLDKMEQYADALGNPAKSLKDIEPLAADLEQTAGRLSELSRSLPEGDPLKGMSNEAAVLATVEAMKFRRGDYV